MALTISAGELLNAYSRTFTNEIAQQIRVGLESESAWRPVVAERTWVSPTATVGNALQSYQTAFTPNVDVTMDDSSYTLRQMKVDLQFSAADLDQFMDSFAVENDQRGQGKSRDMYAFPKYLYDTVILPKIIADIELSAAYKGVYAAPTPSTAGAPSAAVNGLGTEIAARITSGEIPAGNVIATGALATGTILAKVETFVDALDVAVRNSPGVIYMSKTWVRAYIRNYRNTLGTGAGVASELNLEAKIDGTNMKLVGLSSMEGTSRMVLDIDRNIVYGTKRGQGILPQMVWDPDLRVLRGFGEFSRFYGVSNPLRLFVNDVA